jgi:hypothetical protein
MDPVLNELSFCRLSTTEPACAASNRTEARMWMSAFVRTLSETANVGLSRSLRAFDSFAVQEIASGYNVAQWRNDGDVDRDLRQLFRQYTTKSPLLDGLMEMAHGYEARFGGKECQGLLVAYLLDTVAVSLPSDAAWLADRLHIAVDELQNDGHITSASESVLHCSSTEHVLIHAQELRSRREHDVTAGGDLADRRESLLPKIRLCTAAEGTLRSLGGSDPCFCWVRRCLFELNDRCVGWADGEFPNHLLRGNPSPESESVRNNEALRNLRIFMCPDGERRFFNWHLKNNGLNYRLHYLPTNNERVILVGYIGPHLPTALY